MSTPPTPVKPRLHDTTCCQTTDKQLNVCIHDTTRCQSGLTTSLTTGCIVYTAACQTIGKTHSPIFGSFLLWPNRWMQDATWYGGRPQPRRLCLSVLSCPVLSVMLVYCGQTVGWIKMKLGMQVGLGPGHIVLDGDPAPPPQKGGAARLFSDHFCSGQMAARIKMPLDTEVGLGQDDIALDEDPAPPPQKCGGAPSPIFGPCLLWPNGWTDQDGIWH